MPHPKFFTFTPDYTTKCYHCERKPTVVIPEHPCPDTQLCGACFFGDREMEDPEKWNGPTEERE